MADVNNNLNREFEPTQQSNTIDVKRILFRAQRYWYFIVVSLLICLAAAYYKIRYTQHIYPISASIIIREKEETSGAELLYENALINQYRNYLNEPYILRSYPLIQRAVEELNFMVSFYSDGRVISSEVYKTLPLSVSFDPTQVNPASDFYFTVLSSSKFSLEFEKKDGNEIGEFEFGKPFNFGGNNIKIGITPARGLKEMIGKRYRMTFNSSMEITNNYISKLKVEWAIKGAGVMNLSLTGSNSAKEIDFLHGLIKNYQLLDLEKKNQTANRTVSFIKSQLVDISDSLKIFEGQLQQFKKSNRTTGDLSFDAQRVFTRIEALEAQRGELMVKNNYFVYLKKYLSESKTLDQIILPFSMGITDPVLGSLLGKIVDLQLEIKLYFEKERPINPLVTSKLQRLNELKREVMEAITGLQSTDKIKSDFLSKQISDAELQVGYLPLAQRQYISIQRNFTLLENLYVYLMQKKSEAEISKAANVSDLIIVNPPMTSGESIGIKPTQTYLIAFSIGLFIPFLLFVLFELFNTTIQSREDVEKHLTIPFLGGIGHKKSDINLAVFNSPKSAISEAFRSIRSNLSYFVSKQSKGVFLISSSVSGEGKTFTSINLASVFALSNKKTLLIGADMRRPKIFADFNLTNQEGLSSFLAGLVGFDQTIQKTEFDNLWIATGGPIPPNPSELIISSKMKEFLNLAKEKFDIIIIDSPPMALVSDAWELTKLVDHTIFLVRQNYTQKSLLKTIQDFYQSGKLVSISIVLNDIASNGYGYGYGYGYGSYGYSYYQSGKTKDGGYYSE